MQSAIAENLDKVRMRIVSAARRAQRDPDSVTLVAVSKRKPAEDIAVAHAAGQRDFGENYVQELETKSRVLTGLDQVRFHLIGKLQSNKANRAATLFDTIHTVASVKLARRLERTGTSLNIFLEVKLSHESSKSGIDEQQVEALCAAAQSAPNLKLLGLMTMPPWSADPERSREYFRHLNQLAERLGVNCLSMGMSHDFEVAIEEGATHVRIGTAIFGKRSTPAL